jgi:uncharacterized protein (DUF362 family)/NAD-dependent dihydropyrimidine dehydrogenase PreA subunit
MRSKVAIVRCETYDESAVYDALKAGIDSVGGLASVVRKGEKILLKPNVLAGARPEEVVNTHPSVFKAMIDLLLEYEVRVAYGDSPAFEKPETGLTRSGLKAVADGYGLVIGDFERGRSLELKDPLVCGRFEIANAVAESDGIISLSKMKTHMLTRITGAVKNQFGCVYGMNKSAFHVRLPNPVDFSKMLVDLDRLLKPRLYVMDAVLAMEGNGPRGGNPVPMNCLIVSTDPVAVDATFCRMVGLDPRFVPTVVWGHKSGRGTCLAEEIDYTLEPFEKFVNRSFDVVRRPVDNGLLVGRLPGFLRNLFVRKPVIDPEKCVKCGICVEACPVEGKALKFLNGDKKSPPEYDYDLCIRCYCCQEVCPEKAISVTGQGRKRYTQ